MTETPIPAQVSTLDMTPEEMLTEALHRLDAAGQAQVAALFGGAVNFRHEDTGTVTLTGDALRQYALDQVAFVQAYLKAAQVSADLAEYVDAAYDQDDDADDVDPEGDSE